MSWPCWAPRSQLVAPSQQTDWLAVTVIAGFAIVMRTDSTRSGQFTAPRMARFPGRCSVAASSLGTVEHARSWRGHVVGGAGSPAEQPVGISPDSVPVSMGHVVATGPEGADQLEVADAVSPAASRPEILLPRLRSTKL